LDRDILIRAGSLSDFKQSELDALADAITEAISDPDVSVGTATQTNMLGAPLPEIARIVMNFTGGYVAGKVIDVAVHWARETWKQHQTEKERPQALLVEILGPKGEVLSRVVCEEPDGEPQPYPERVGPPGSRPRPPVWRHGPRSRPSEPADKST
jgi:hypothetical protein